MLATMRTPPVQTEGDRTDVRRRLLEAAAQLLDEEGPQALTARRLAATAGTSTMAVYTHFGGMPALVREIVVEGFDRLAAHITDHPRTEDPVADLVDLALAYRANALENPHLYSVMFGATSLGGYSLAPEDRAVGTYTFDVLSAAVARAMDAGRLRRADPDLVAQQLWTAMHGYVMLEMAGMHLSCEDPAREVLRPLMTTLLEGLAAQTPESVGGPDQEGP
jgi:AcrR family transcriptional regulator